MKTYLECLEERKEQLRETYKTEPNDNVRNIISGKIDALQFAIDMYKVKSLYSELREVVFNDTTHE